MDITIPGDERIRYKHSQKVCFERLPYSKDEDNIVNRWVKFPYNDSPQIVSSNTISVLIIDGKLEGIGFNTSGVSVDTTVLEKLKEKYGPPTALTTSKLQNRMGATFDKFIGIWTFSDLRVTFQSITDSLDSGLVNIDTTKGYTYRDAKLKELTKDKRPL